MKIPVPLLALVLCSLISQKVYAQDTVAPKFKTPYGNNPQVGKYALVNGAQIYYEEYGAGTPLLLIHGNSGSIQTMAYQIEYFKNKYRVIVADSRGHGKSQLKTDSLTYTQMAHDWDALVKHLALDSINIIGWSDGGIIALKMGLAGQSKIMKMVAMGANLRPDSSAIHAWSVNDVVEAQKMIRAKIAAQDSTENWDLQKQLVGLLVDQPQIATEDLANLKAKVLIIAGDEDFIRNEHTVEMYEHIPKAHLCIMPGETHSMPASSPELFNSIVYKFLKEPFKRPYSQ